MVSRKQEHSKKPDLAYDLIERCSPGPYLELFARNPREGWAQWGDEAATSGDLRQISRQLLENPPATVKEQNRIRVEKSLSLW
jgi:N6-adenosine-specific RNA methylase IME4